MKALRYSQRSYKSLVFAFVFSLLSASCGNTVIPCLPVKAVEDWELNAIKVLDWWVKIGDDINVRMIVTGDNNDDLFVRAVFTDNAKKRVTVLPLEKFLLSPVYVVWIDDAISKTLKDGQPYTTIHTLGYVSPELYVGRNLDSASFGFQPEANKQIANKDFFYRTGQFEGGVFWFPTTNIDFEKYIYINRISIDSEESLATSVAMNGPGTYTEWEQQFEPAVNIEDRLLKLSQLNWIDITGNTECAKLN